VKRSGHEREPDIEAARAHATPATPLDSATVGPSSAGDRKGAAPEIRAASRGRRIPTDQGRSRGPRTSEGGARPLTDIALASVSKRRPAQSTSALVHRLCLARSVSRGACGTTPQRGRRPQSSLQVSAQRMIRNVRSSNSVEPSSWILTSPWAVRYLPVPPVMAKKYGSSLNSSSAP
jgi:hypothetical protein